MSTGKLTIAVRVVLGLALAVALFYAIVIYKFSHMKLGLDPEFAKDVQDIGVAVKGIAGEALFEYGNLIPNEASMPAGSDGIEKARTLMAAYGKDPGKFKKYAALFDTAVNAGAVGDAVLQMPPSARLPANSLGLRSLRGDQRVDAWGHPYCLLTSRNLLAVISLGPEAKTAATCRNLEISKEKIFSAQRNLYERPSGEVILIVDRTSRDPSIKQAMERR
ncbi:MAG TPA: hypothetical protein VLY23_10570 [Candidatus Acidoferrum sp.]|nr:hypothetical protein [Candidatus Acidoferrum sp.]